MNSNSIEALAEELRTNSFDPNSFAHPDQVKVVHLHLALVVDFDKHTLAGHTILSVDKVASNAAKLTLDTVDLTIFNIQLVEGDLKRKLPYQLHCPVLEFGSKLEIDISSIEKSQFKIQIDYSTLENARALLWLTPEQTDGGQFPFLFSQGQMINIRSIVPCQDTPSVKSTYTAEIEAPKYVTVLMSAKISGPPTQSQTNQANQIHHFTQTVPIPSYLIAIVAGDLVSKQIGPRSHVWSEKSLIDQAAWEFEHVEQNLQIAEQYAGPYLFEVYDLLVLPASFPFGGMENPCLTFVTPTVLAGDRSLVSVLAHEIFHSWTGNSVTCQNYQHMWLNEGFTTFVERKIIAQLGGGEQERHFQALEGLKELQIIVDSLGANNPLTNLVPDFRGLNPDDAFNLVPYEKGHSLLFYLEQLLGGPEVFDPFVRSYIEHFKFQSINTDQFRQYLVDYFCNNGTTEQNKRLRDVNWNGWLNTPGMPHIIPDYDTTLLDAAVELANRWTDISDEQLKSNSNSFTFEEFKLLNANQKKLFLMELNERTESKRMSSDKLEILTELYQLKAKNNSEIRCAWIVLGLKSHWKGVIPDAVEMVTQIGRMKYLRPIYRAMFKWQKTRQLALETFEANKPRLMVLSTLAISNELELK